jgi:nicotinamide riboside transporter PnuC
MWIITLISLIGVILNIKKRRECFMIWTVSNFAWMVYDFKIGAYAQSALFAVYFVLAVWGLYEWKEKN